jgi:hypothetical protein
MGTAVLTRIEQGGFARPPTSEEYRRVLDEAVAWLVAQAAAPS